MQYYIVDAFTDRLFGGNPAGVVILEDNVFPDDTLMQQIAAELRLSETAFVQQNGPHEFTIRYFTPVAEVPLCGHATIAAFGIITKMGIVTEEHAHCVNHTKAGDLQVITGNVIMMEMASPLLLDTIREPEQLDRLYRIMGARRDGVTLLPQIISTGLPDIIMPVRDVEALQSLSPDMPALSALSDELRVTGAHVFALNDDSYTAHVRNFGPLYGIDEESATGTANAALSYYLHLNGIIGSPAECHFLQGEAMSRPSVITTQLHSCINRCNIWVGGESRIVANGDLWID
jgi:PhzF family phenazine biosynthesis protein